MRPLIAIALCLASLLLMVGHALAQPVPALPDPSLVVGALQAHNLPLLIPPLCGLASYLLRRFAPQAHFFHTAWGALVFAGVSAALSVLGSAVASKGLSLDTLVLVVEAVVVSLLSTSNPSVPAGVTSPLAMRRPQRGMVRLRLLVVLGALPLLMGAAGGSCRDKAKAVAVDLGHCAVGEVPAAVGDVLPTLEGAIGGAAATWSTAETNAIASLGIDLAECAFSALFHRLSMHKAALAEQVGHQAAIVLDRAELAIEHTRSLRRLAQAVR